MINAKALINARKGIMLTEINPKLPMRNKNVTIAYYIDQLGFQVFGRADYDDYLMLEKDEIQIHFFAFKGLTQKRITDRFIFASTISTSFTRHYWIVTPPFTQTANWKPSLGAKGILFA